ncbi:MAG: sugar ABC transporter ATP-binding protein, partial [Spirochaetia bacterium]
PTAGLDESEVDSLLDFIRQLKNQGVTIIYVSHILEEVQRIADEIMVLRDGKKVDVVKASEVPMDEVIRMMVGHEMGARAMGKKARPRGSQVLSVSAISTLDSYVNDVSFELHEGEILGFAGLTSSGRSELIRALYGVGRISKGKMYVNGKLQVLSSTKKASDLGIGMIPRDRKEEGIFGIRNIKENITISSIKNVSGALGFIRNKQENNVATDIMKELSIRAPSFSVSSGSLSGGNQQKVIFGRWLAARPNILLCDEPTRGIDIGAKAEIARIIKELADEKISVIISSSEVPELIEICDRILVMFEGRIVREFLAETVVKEDLIRCIIGGT